MSKIRLPFLVALLAVQPVVASAGGIVFDPSNFSKNIITATTSLRIEANQVIDKINQAKQLESMLTNLKQLDPSKYAAQIAGVQDTLKTYNQYRASLADVNNALGGQAKFLDNLQTNYTLSGSGKLSDYLQVLQRRADGGSAQAQQLINMAESTSKNVENTAKRRVDLQKQVEASDGALASSQTTNQYLDLIVSQNSELTSYMAENARQQAEDRKNAALSAESRKNNLSKAAAENKAAIDSFGDRWNKSK